ncbi:hypothetical protein HPG69_012410, partial [Diceros bicornis minor]
MQRSWCQPGCQVYVQFTPDSLFRLFVVVLCSTSGIPHDCICFRFKSNERVIVGATNFPEALDNALIHPGHFDMQVTVPRPDVKGQTEILKWYLNKIKFDQ